MLCVEQGGFTGYSKPLCLLDWLSNQPKFEQVRTLPDLPFSLLQFLNILLRPHNLSVQKCCLIRSQPHCRMTSQFHFSTVSDVSLHIRLHHLHESAKSGVARGKVTAPMRALRPDAFLHSMAFQQIPVNMPRMQVSDRDAAASVLTLYMTQQMHQSLFAGAIGRRALLVELGTAGGNIDDCTLLFLLHFPVENIGILLCLGHGLR